MTPLRYLCALAVAACACGRTHVDPSADGGGVGSRDMHAVAVKIDGQASSSSVPGSGASTSAARAFEGTYTSTVGSLYIPADWKGVRWNVPASPAGMGEGQISFTAAAGSGRVHGALTGPLGPAIVEGLLADGTLTATIRRQDPRDQGFAGTLIGALVQDKVEGTMNVSLGEAGAIRVARFSASLIGTGASP